MPIPLTVRKASTPSFFHAPSMRWQPVATGFMPALCATGEGLADAGIGAQHGTIMRCLSRTGIARVA